MSDKGRKESESESGNKQRESEAGKEKESESGKERVKVIEGVIFIPFTLDSKLREEIQRVEETLTAEMRTPSIRFVERGGESVTQILERNNPWSKESECGRKVCPPCWGRRWIAMKKEEESMRLVSGEGESVEKESVSNKESEREGESESDNVEKESASNKESERERESESDKTGKEAESESGRRMERVSVSGKREEKKRERKEETALPLCTKESINYTIECIPCKEEGKRRIYWGETSRSGNQRGAEHYREINNGVQTHPLVLHYVEEHNGEKQPFLIESIRIEEGGKSPEESLNQKSEWAASKLPSILIRKAKFTTNRKKEKRVKYQEGNSLEEQTALLEGYKQRKRARKNNHS